jgi:uncharacterized protein YndB with AHSA1/START domain
MTKKTKPAASTEVSKQKITIERTFRASVEDVWDLWTTKKGLESWWGPEGFVTAVHKLDPRPGGRFEYEMTATAPAQVGAMKKANLPLTSRAHGTYVEVTPGRRLAYRTLADFIPGVAPYEIGAVVDFHTGPQGVRLTINEDAMHNEEWTKMSAMGMNSSLDRLAKVLEARRGHK